MAEQPLSDAELKSLRSILKGLSPQEWRALKAIAGGVVNAIGGGSGSGGSGPAVATDGELAGRYGDPTVRKDPKRWAGASYVGATYSKCPSDYLFVLAEQFEWSAEQDQKKGDAAGKNNKGEFWWKWNLKDAAKARGWARRNQGKDMPPPSNAGHGSDDGGGDDFNQSGGVGGDDDWVPT